MAGNIGLTAAGQYLDDVLTKTNPSYRRSLTMFINNFTATMKRLRKAVDICTALNDKVLLLHGVRKEYVSRFDKKFKSIVDNLVYRLTLSYIYALTTPGFTPTTTTQLALIRKQNQVLESRDTGQ
jgi:hypothetical protein